MKYSEWEQEALEQELTIKPCDCGMPCPDKRSKICDTVIALDHNKRIMGTYKKNYNYGWLNV